MYQASKTLVRRQRPAAQDVSSFTYFRRLLGFVWPQKRYVYPAIFCIILVAVTYSASIGSVLPLLYAMIQPEGVHGWVHQQLAEKRLEARFSIYSRLKDRPVPGVADGALRIRDLRPNSPLAVAGLQEGDLILPMDDRGDPVNLLRQLSGLSEHVEITFLAVPAIEARTTVLTAPALGLPYGIVRRAVEWLPGGSAPDQKMKTLAVMLGLLMVLVVLGSAARVLAEYLTAIAIGRGVVDMRRRMYTHMFNLPLSRFSQNTSDTMSKYIQDMNDIVRGLENFFQKLITEPFKAIGVTMIALYLNWQLTLTVLLGLPVAVVLFRKLGKRVRRANKKLLVGYGQMLGVLESTLSGMRVVKGYRREGYECRRLFRIDRKLLRQQLKIKFVEALASPFVETLGFMVGAGAILYFAHGMYTRGIQPPELVVMLVCLGGIFDPVRKLSTVYPKIQRANAAAERVFELIDSPSEYTQDAGRLRLRPFPRAAGATPASDGHRATIQFDDVSFTYPGATRPAVRDLSLTVYQGEIIALVGPNGSGKTTLVSLLPRLFPVTSGRILIGGQDISEVSLRSLRDQFCLITQESVIFPDTVRSNIAYGKPDATQEEIEAAAAAAFADEFIRQMPEGYDTVLGEHGATLSGGQRQRIAIARAILRDAPILIFDEATSQVDPESELKIHQALEAFLKGRTAFVIAHRHATVADADRIAVMDDGRLVAEGTHDQLLLACPLYRRLYETQFRDASADPELQADEPRAIANTEPTGV